MARQKGILKIKGTLGGMTFYKTAADGDLVREKGGISGERIANDAAFVRTRENNSEFGAAGAAGKVFRDSFRNMMMGAADGRVTSRVTKTMMDILKLDATNPRGKRLPATGLALPAGKALLKGFNFNLQAIVGAILFKPYVLTPATGVITITGLLPSSDIVAPTGATHFSLTGAYGNVNFATGVVDVKLSNVVNTAMTAAVGNIVLTPTAVPVGTGIKFYLLKIEFFQLVNGIQYSLRNGSYNALAVIEVA